MMALLPSSETSARQQAIKRTAFRGAVARAFEAVDTPEILANPDGAIWIERAGSGLARSDERLGAAERERIIRLVASAAGEHCDKVDAERLLSKKRRHWFAKRKSVAALLRETLFQEESLLVDDDAAN